MSLHSDLNHKSLTTQRKICEPLVIFLHRGFGPLGLMSCFWWINKSPITIFPFDLLNMFGKLKRICLQKHRWGMKTSTEEIAVLCFLVFICGWCFMGCELSVHQSDGLEENSACGRKEPSILLNFISQIKELIHIAEREKTSSADLSVYSTAYKITQCWGNLMFCQSTILCNWNLLTFLISIT